MKIATVAVTDFRSYAEYSLTLSAPTTLLYGPNGCGKTNLLEAMYLASVGKSPRTSHDRLMIRHSAESAAVRVDFTRHEVAQKIQINVYKNKRKEMWINATPVRQKELVGTLHTVYFGPDDLQLIKGSPQRRRRFLDLSLARANSLYYDALLRYNRILAQRNQLLKAQRVADLTPWDEQLATQAVYITRARLQALEEWNTLVGPTSQTWSAGDLNVHLKYSRSYAKSEDISKEEYLHLYKETLERDLKSGFTSIGPHRADVVFYHEDKNLADYGSQGEQRLAILALKLSETTYLKEHVGELPVLLLDDVLSELDEERQQELLRWTADRQLQLIMTAAYRPNRLPEPVDMRCLEKSHGA